jgi:hypothetical protein
MHKRHKICFWSLAHHKGCLRLCWGAHKEPGLSQPQTLLNDHQDLVQCSTVKSPRRRGQYKLFEVHHNLDDSWTILVHLGDKYPRVTNARRSSMKCFAWRFWGSLKMVAQISLRKLGLEWSLRERGFELQRECFKVFTRVLSGQPSWGSMGAFYSPRPGVIFPLGVSETRTCLQRLIGTRPWCRTCPVLGPNPCYNLEAGHVRSRDRICPGLVTVTRFSCG